MPYIQCNKRFTGMSQVKYFGDKPSQEVSRYKMYYSKSVENW